MSRVDVRNLVEALIDPKTGDVIEARIPGFRHWGSHDVANVVLLKDPDLRTELNLARANRENQISSTLQFEPFRELPYAEYERFVNEDGQVERRMTKRSRVRVDVAAMADKHRQRLGKVVRYREHPAVLRRDLRDDANDDVRPIKEDEIAVIVDAPTRDRESRDTSNVQLNVTRSNRLEVTDDPEGVNGSVAVERQVDGRR